METEAPRPESWVWQGRTGGPRAELCAVEAPQWPSTVGRGACEQADVPPLPDYAGPQDSPCPSGPRLPWASVGLFPCLFPLGSTGAFRVHIPRVNEGVRKGVGPGQGLDLWVPLSARDGAAGGREGGGLWAVGRM